MTIGVCGTGAETTKPPFSMVPTASGDPTLGGTNVVESDASEGAGDPELLWRDWESAVDVSSSTRGVDIWAETVCNASTSWGRGVAAEVSTSTASSSLTAAAPVLGRVVMTPSVDSEDVAPWGSWEASLKMNIDLSVLPSSEQRGQWTFLRCAKERTTIYTPTPFKKPLLNDIVPILPTELTEVQTVVSFPLTKASLGRH